MLTPEFQERFRWRDWLPWLTLLRTWEFAVRGTPLACALVGTILCWGARDLGQWFQTPPKPADEVAKPEESLDLYSRLLTEVPVPAELPAVKEFVPELPSVRVPADVFWPWRGVAGPLQEVVRLSTWRGRLGAALSAGLQLVIWAWLGAVICRHAVGCLSETRDGLPAAVTFGLRRWPQAIGGPCLPLAASAVLAVVLFVLMLPGRMPLYLGLTWLVVVSPVLVLIGLMAAFLVGILLVSWPLIQTAVVVDKDCDGFNALSRVYNYVTVRPWHLAWYVAVVLVTGPLVLFVAEWGVNGMVALLTQTADIGAGLYGEGPAFGATLRWWADLALTTFAASYFWSATGLAYVLLRRSVDGMPCEQLVPLDGGKQNREPYPVVGMAAAAPVTSETSAADAGSEE